MATSTSSSIEAMNTNTTSASATYLDPSDPVERILLEMRDLNRNKRGDYANPDDIFSNFRQSADHVGITPVAACEILVATKQARIKELMHRSPVNEARRDSYIDRAVYAVLALALLDEAALVTPQENTRPRMKGQ